MLVFLIETRSSLATGMAVKSILDTYNRYGFYLYEINVFTCS